MANEVGGLKNSPMPLRPQVDPKAMDQKLHEVASLYEEQFMREMVKAMRSTVPESGLVKVGQAEQIYREQLDQNYVNQWSKRGGVGLQDLIYKQLTEKYGAKLGLSAGAQKPQGPISLDAKSEFQANFHQSGKKLQVQLERPKSLENQTEKITTPWDASLLGVQEINPNEYVVNLGHEGGKRSQIVFRGTLDSEILQNPSRPIPAGSPVGYLNPDAQTLFWNLQ
jgi:flagellar protein FlgJ